MKIKYQIFVSSTFEDLREERELVIKAILEMGHIPVGMEMFSAGDQEQWKLIQKQIEDCDYYIVIAAHRYGSLDGEIGYTEKEYDYAISLGIPILGFVIDNKVDWPLQKSDEDPLKKQKLELFKEKIKKKLISYWSDKNDLYGKVSISLMKQFNTNPRNGWVKASETASVDILAELSRLSKENAQLRESLEQIDLSSKREESEYRIKLISILRNNKRNISYFYQKGTNWEDSIEISLYRIFNIIAPDLMIENSNMKIGRMIGIMTNPNKDRTLREPWGVPSNTVQSILADLNILGLIIPSPIKHKIDDQNQYWSIAELGKEIFREIRMEVLVSEPSDDIPF